MTTLALQSLSFSTKILEKLGTFLKKSFQGLVIGYMIARQTQANQKIADQLCRFGEYKRDEYYNVLADLNKRTIAQIQKEFS